MENFFNEINERDSRYFIILVISLLVVLSVLIYLKTQNFLIFLLFILPAVLISLKFIDRIMKKYLKNFTITGELKDDSKIIDYSFTSGETKEQLVRSINLLVAKNAKMEIALKDNNIPFEFKSNSILTFEVEYTDGTGTKGTARVLEKDRIDSIDSIDMKVFG